MLKFLTQFVIMFSLFANGLPVNPCTKIVTVIFPSCSAGPICTFKVLENDLIYTLATTVKHRNKIWVDHQGNPICKERR